MSELPKTKAPLDTRFHRKILGSLTDFNEQRPPGLIYVENGNWNFGYDLLALDYKMAADLIIQEEKSTGLGNWTAPLAFMVRQTLELSLKSLLETTGWRGNTVSPKVIFSHNLERIWNDSREWLLKNGYPVNSDARYENTEWIICNFNSVDPSGDLFRFAQSKLSAFGRLKTYDRAGVYPKILVPYFEDAYEFLSHWSAVLAQETFKIQAEESGEDYDPPFDPDGFPRKPATP